MLRKMKRFLSVREGSPIPSRRTYQRQSSENSVFFPSHEMHHIGKLQEMHSRGRRFPSDGWKNHDGPDRNMKVHGNEDLGIIRETSKSEALETCSQFSEDENTTQEDSPTSEKIISETEVKEARPDPQTNGTHVLSEKGSSSPNESPTDSEGLILILCEPHISPTVSLGSPSEIAPPHLETKSQDEKDEEQPNWPDHQMWVFPSVHAHQAVPSTTNEPLLVGPGTSSIRSNISPESNTPASANKVGISHVLEQLNTQETDIVDIV